MINDRNRPSWTGPSTAEFLNEFHIPNGRGKTSMEPVGLCKATNPIGVLWLLCVRARACLDRD